MNKTAIKNFAIWARVQLIESAKQRAFEYEIAETGENNTGLKSVGGRLLTATEKDQRKQLIEQIRQKGYAQVMEEAAYTWFNRFIALRFMEVNGYLPSKVRVFTDENGEFKPEILKQAMTVELEGLDRTHVLDLLDKQNNEELFKYLIITQCNALSTGLPYVFEKVANWTELLFPDNLLRSDSVIGRMISDIDAEDWADEVEIIGWMYQYYISEKHDEVVDPLHGKVCKKEDIPAATQLFTTDWVVRYILDNSLGRYWIERHPESKLAEKLEFFVTPKDGEIPAVNESIAPEELKVLDPCVGSGHFLSYAFDVLLEIYRESGWSDRDAAKSILESNLYGLDIDDRAAQLACFAVMMKARKYNRRIISADTTLHIMAMQDSTGVSDELIHYAAGRDAAIKNDLNELHILFNNAKEYGSAIKVPKLDFSSIYTRFNEIANDYSSNLMEVGYKNSVVDLLLPLVKQAEILSEKYDVVATNPPYLNKYSPRLKAFISEHYEAFKGDLFSVFIYRNFDFCKPNGYSGFMTPMVWMFIKTYEELRKYIITQKSFATLIQFEYSAFEEATVPICSFVLKNGKETTKGLYFKLSDFRGGMQIQKEKVLDALVNRDCGYYYEADEANFSKIPGSPVAYWASNRMYYAFENGKKFSGETKKGVLTGDNNRFLRLWFEVDNKKTSFSMKNHEEMVQSGLKWFPVTSGGIKRKWYGNLDTVVNLENDGLEIKTHVTNYRLRDSQYYFLEAVTWTEVSSGMFSCRYVPQGVLFGNGGPVCFFFNGALRYNLGLLNSKVICSIMAYMAPTINYGPEQVEKIPVFEEAKEDVDILVNDNIVMSKKDWDFFETSWDFKKHPLIQYRHAKPEERMVASQYGTAVQCPIGYAYSEWMLACEDRFNQLKANEEELNRIFIEIYGLQDELTPEVEDKDVTVRKADLQREIKSLISYAVGCMFGRYSVNAEGLQFAGGDWSEWYKANSQQLTANGYFVDQNNIIPICDDEYFDDDIVGYFVRWVKATYGEDTLEENLRFIADALGGKGTSREVIRSYFLNGFYADHLKIYQKRPIYWLFSSGKKNGFKALIYMHRYQPDLLARMRTDYVHEQQERYRTQLQALEDAAQTAAPSDRVKLNKQIANLKDQMLEIQQYEEKIHHLADQMISIDLDDGVKVNYAKFQDVLEKIK